MKKQIEGRGTSIGGRFSRMPGRRDEREGNPFKIITPARSKKRGEKEERGG